jgi:hypothetical protein
MWPNSATQMRIVKVEFAGAIFVPWRDLRDLEALHGDSEKTGRRGDGVGGSTRTAGAVLEVSPGHHIFSLRV